MAITAPSLTVADVQTIMTRFEGPLTELMSAAQLEHTATITGITKANPGVITADHEFIDGDTPLLAGIVGMTELNGTSPTVTVIDDSSFSIDVDTRAYTTYVSGGTAYRARSNWTKKITGAWSLFTFDLRNELNLELDRISTLDSESATNYVQEDFNVLTALLALALIFSDAVENVGMDAAEKYLAKSEQYRSAYEKRFATLKIDYDISDDGAIDDSEEGLEIEAGWQL